MAHLGRNLLPTWPILRPSWAHLRQKSPPNRARNLKKRPQIPQDPQGVARGLQDSPWSLNFYGFGVDFGPHFKSCSAVSPSILHGLSASSSRHVAAWRAQRIGYPPPPRSGWSGVCESGIESCQNPIFQLRKGSRGSAARAQVATAATVPSELQSTFRLQLAI